MAANNTPGTNNPRGRPKGSINKLTAEMTELLDAEPGEHPAVLLKRIINDPKTEKALVVQASATLLPYMAPKLRSIEISSEEQLTITGVTFKTQLPERPDWSEDKDEL